MPVGDKSAYTGKQKRQAEHIEDSYELRGVEHEEAERRAWATVNKESGGGRLSGSGRKKSANTPAENSVSSSDSSQSINKRSEAARKGWETRRHHAV